MKLRALTATEIKKFASRKGVKSESVANYLASMGGDFYAAKANLDQDARSYRWNAATIKAIQAGMTLASKPVKDDAPKSYGSYVLGSDPGVV